MYTKNLLKSTKAEDEFQSKFINKYCHEHDKRVDKICLHQTCLINWEQALLCDICYNDHKKTHLDIDTYINYDNTVPNELAYRIDNYLKDDKRKRFDELLNKIDLAYNDYQKLIEQKLESSKNKLKQEVFDKWNNLNAINLMINLKDSLLKDQDNIMNRMDIDVNEMIQLHCNMMKINIKKYENLKGLIFNNEKEIQKALQKISEDIQQQQIAIVTIIQDSSIELKKKIFESNTSYIAPISPEYKKTKNKIKVTLYNM